MFKILLYGLVMIVGAFFLPQWVIMLAMGLWAWNFVKKAIRGKKWVLTNSTVYITLLPSYLVPPITERIGAQEALTNLFMEIDPEIKVKIKQITEEAHEILSPIINIVALLGEYDENASIELYARGVNKTTNKNYEVKIIVSLI